MDMDKVAGLVGTTIEAGGLQLLITHAEIRTDGFAHYGIGGMKSAKVSAIVTGAAPEAKRSGE